MSSTLAAGSLEAECLGGLDWAWYGLGECIRSSGDKVSIAFGVLSIVAWFLFGLPQIVENFRSKIPDAAVSIFLLIFWLLGDSLNLIGAFLTYQLFLQKILAGYTVFIDIILLSQYAYYRWLHKKGTKHEEEIEDGSGEGPLGDEEEVETSSSSTKGKVMASVLLGFVGLSLLPLQLSGGDSASVSSGQGQRSLFQTSSTATVNIWDNFLSTDTAKIGYIFGCISASMYILGRLHQIYLNWRRKCTDGLSYYLFILAILGNTFYACQIFTKSIDSVFILNSLPWILGSLGILLFDAVILAQFLLYRNHGTKAAQKKVDSETDGEEETSEEKL